MRAFGWFIITLLLGACSADKPSKKCIYPAGELFFSGSHINTYLTFIFLYYL